MCFAGLEDEIPCDFNEQINKFQFGDIFSLTQKPAAEALHGKRFTIFYAFVRSL